MNVLAILTDAHPEALGCMELPLPTTDSQSPFNPPQEISSGDEGVAEPLWMVIARRFGVDRAIGFAVLARLWQLLTGPLTQLLIVFWLTGVEQGFYYAFLNLLAMQIFVELGLHVVIINVASHEWSGLTFDDGVVSGDDLNRSRLRSLITASLRWYGVAALLFIGVLSVFGLSFFSGIDRVSDLTIGWKAPWLVLVTLTGLQLALLPLTAILEGCGQLSVVNRVRFFQGVVGSLTVWCLITSGMGLWALCGSAAVRLIGELWLIGRRYLPFFRSIFSASRTASLDWRTEVLPLQWRMAVQGCLLWLSTHLAGLVILKYHGPVASGQFGMMWTILTALQAGALSWVETRRPVFGQLIARRNYDELDALFLRYSRISMGLIVTGNALFVLGVWLVNIVPFEICYRIADRLPAPQTTAIFAASLVVMHLAQCTNIYVRAHKKDPYLVPALVANPIVGGLVCWLGIRSSVFGVAVGYFVGVALVQVPLWMCVWVRTRQRWHQQELGS